MGMVSEFREFAMRGNVIDLAVGVVIGVLVLSVGIETARLREIRAEVRTG